MEGTFSFGKQPNMIQQRKKEVVDEPQQL